MKPSFTHPINSITINQHMKEEINHKEPFPSCLEWTTPNYVYIVWNQTYEQQAQQQSQQYITIVYNHASLCNL